LRKAAATRLIDAGCDVVEAAAITSPYRKSNPLAVDRELGDAAARCRTYAN
jgi:hypothetical protein